MDNQQGTVQNPFKLPEFPTTYTDQDKQRKADLETQLKSLSEIYSQQFTAEQWENTNIAEKATRSIVANTPWMDIITKNVTPESWGFDLGDRDMAQQRLMEMQTELLDLSRRELVTNLLPDIKTDLRIAMIAGQPITDMGDLTEKFPELKANFTDEERAYIADLANMVANANMADVLSGKVFEEFAGNQDQKIIDGLKAFFAEQQSINPSMILSTVAYTQNQALINQALRMAFPPSGVEQQEQAKFDKVNEATSARENVLGLGFGVDVGKAIKDKHTKVATDTGTLTVLADTATGKMTTANIAEDYIVRANGEIVGWINPTDPNKQVQPISNQVYVEEGKGKDIVDSFKLGINKVFNNFKNFFTSTIQQINTESIIGETMLNMPQEQLLSGGYAEAQEIKARSNALSEERYQANLASWEAFQAEHPELQPRTEWTQGWKAGMAADPWGYIAYQIASTAPSMIGGMLTGTATTLATGDPFTGSLVGAATMAPEVIQDLYDDLRANGADQETATALSASMGAAIAGVEMLGEISALGAASEVVQSTLRKNLIDEFVKLGTKELSKKVVKTITSIEAGEITEEILQDVLQNVAVNLVNKDRELIGDLDETIVNTALATAPMALLGGGGNIITNMQAKTPTTTQNARLEQGAGTAIIPYTAGQEDWDGWTAPGVKLPGAERVVDLKELAGVLTQVLVDQQANTVNPDIDTAYRGLSQVLMNFQFSRWMKSNQYLNLNQEIQDKLLMAIMGNDAVTDKLLAIRDEYKSAIKEGKANIQDMLLDLFSAVEDIIEKEAQNQVRKYYAYRGQEINPTDPTFTEELVGQQWDNDAFNKFKVLADAGLMDKFESNKWSDLNAAQKAKIMKALAPKPIDRTAEQEQARIDKIIQPIRKGAPKAVANAQQSINDLSLSIDELARNILAQEARMEKVGSIGYEEQVALIDDMKKQLSGLVHSRKLQEGILATAQAQEAAKTPAKKPLQTNLEANTQQAMLDSRNIELAERAGGLIRKLENGKFRAVKSTGQARTFPTSKAALEYVRTPVKVKSKESVDPILKSTSLYELERELTKVTFQMNKSTGQPALDAAARFDAIMERIMQIENEDLPEQSTQEEDLAALQESFTEEQEQEIIANFVGASGISADLDTEGVRAELEKLGMAIPQETMPTQAEQGMFDDMVKFVYGYYSLAKERLSTRAIDKLAKLVLPYAENFFKRVQANPGNMYHDESWLRMARTTLTNAIPDLSGNRNDKVIALDAIVSLIHQAESNVMHDLFNMTEFPSLDTSDAVVESINTILRSLAAGQEKNLVPSDVADINIPVEVVNPETKRTIPVQGGTVEQQTALKSWMDILSPALLAKVSGVNILDKSQVEAHEFLGTEYAASYDAETGVIDIRDDKVNSQTFYHEVGHAILENNIQEGIALIQEFSENFEVRGESPSGYPTTYHGIGDVQEIFMEKKADNPEMSDSDVWSMLANTNESIHAYEEGFVDELSNYLISEQTNPDMDAWFAAKFPGRGIPRTTQATMIGEPGIQVDQPDYNAEIGAIGQELSQEIAPAEGAGIAAYWEELSVNERMMMLREGNLPDNAAFTNELDALPENVRDWIEGQWRYLDDQLLLGEKRIHPSYMRVPVELDIERYYNEGMYAASNNPAFKNVATPFKKQQQMEKAGKAIWLLSTDKEKAEAVKRMGLPKATAGKGWDNMTPKEKGLLAMDAVPDNSLFMPRRYELVNIYEWFQLFEERTNLPFTPIGMWVSRARSKVNTLREMTLRDFDRNPAIQRVAKNKKSTERVAEARRALDEGKALPTDLTADEITAIEAIADVYKSLAPWVRYLRVMKAGTDMDSMRKAFPDAVEAGKENELVTALEIKLSGNKDALRTYLWNLTWGIIESGYDPRYIYDASFRAKRIDIDTTIGEGRLRRRTAADYLEGNLGNPFTGVSKYVKAIYTQVLVEPVLSDVEEMWFPVARKFKNAEYVRSSLANWSARVQGIPIIKNGVEEIIEKVAIQGMKSIFADPALALRNLPQTLVFHNEKSELIRSLFERFPQEETEFYKFFFDSYVSNFGGLKKNWLGIEEDESKEGKILKPLNDLIDKISLYDISDYIPRLHSFKASYGKAKRAMNIYLASNRDEPALRKFVKDSGLITLRKTEQNFILNQFLANPDMIFPDELPGLTRNGGEIATVEIAKRITDRVSGQYNRWERGLMEMSGNGLNYWNLVVYPRMVAQNLIFEAENIKNAFKGEQTWDGARIAFKHLLTLVMTAQVAGAVYCLISGKERNPWDMVGTLSGWEFGGLVFSIPMQLGTLIADIVKATPLNANEEERMAALKRIPEELVTFAETEIPFLRTILNVVDTMLGTKDAATQGIRALLDTKTALELEEAERTTWESWRQALLGWEANPTDFTILQGKVLAEEANLGVPDRMGNKTTTKQFGAFLESTLKTVPDAMLTKDDDWTDLTMFYLECRANWAEYYALPNDAKARSDWRKSHLVADAQMLFWGKQGSFIYPAGSPEVEPYEKLFQHWLSLYNLTWSQLPKADWTYPNIVK